MQHTRAHRADTRAVGGAHLSCADRRCDCGTDAIQRATAVVVGDSARDARARGAGRPEL